MFDQTQGTNAGEWELDEVQSYSGTTLTLVNPVNNNYSNQAQVLVVPQYHNITIASGVTYSVKPWNGSTGGILAFLSDGTVTVNGTINADVAGFRGGASVIGAQQGYQGEGTAGTGAAINAANGNGGGGATITSDLHGQAQGGGGGNGTTGQIGGVDQPSRTGGAGGNTVGSSDLTSMDLGGGGGGGAEQSGGGTVTNGKNGGGIVFISGITVTVTGAITANGGSGSDNSGGGSGGSILVKAQTASLGNNIIAANGGAPYSNGLAPVAAGGGDGRIRVDYFTSVTGTTTPAASTFQDSSLGTGQPTPTPTQAISPFGNGSDGDLTISSNTSETGTVIDAPINITASNTTATVNSGLGFAAGQIVMLDQAQGANVGEWELDQVQSYSGTTLTFVNPVKNTYTSDSGNNHAQVRVIPQYHNVTINSGVTYSAKPWNGSTGGILAFLANGTVNVNGTIDGSSGGFRGIGGSGGNYTEQGEGTLGLGTLSNLANGNGGGGGQREGAGQVWGSGGGGSNGSSGTTGVGHNGGFNGNPGSLSGSTDLTNMTFGGAGGAGNSSGGGVQGGNGGAIVFISGVTFNLTGAITTNGQNGNIGAFSSGVSGAGSGGSVLIKAQTASVGTNLINATGGTGPTSSYGSVGGNGGNGRICIDYFTSVTGTTTPTACTNQDSSLAFTYTLSGTVYNDNNQNDVLDTGETGYQGATVTLSNGQTTTTDANGSYSFPQVPQGNYTETLTIPTGYTATTTNPVSVTLSANKTQNFGITHTAPATTASLSPSPFTDGAYPNPVTVTLTATAEAGFNVASTYYTLDSGTQQLYNAPLTVSGAGNHTITYWSVDNTGLQESAHTRNFTIASYTLSGTVYNDNNKNGIQEAGETGYQGATITLSNGQTATTDANGNYSITATAGSYTETLTVPNGYTPTTTNPVSVTLTSNTTQNFGITHTQPTTTASLSPSPWTDGTYHDPTTVTLSATAEAGFTVANTYYTIDGGTQQTYTSPFTVTQAGNYTITYWSVDNAGLQESQNTKTFTITEGHLLSGTVYNDTNGNGIQDPGEQGYSGATVTLNTGQSTTTDSNGNYTFSTIEAGTYTETLTIPTGYTATTTNPATISLAADTTENFGIQNNSLVTAINAGGDTQGNFVADTDYSGGSTYTSNASVDMSNVTNPAPQAVYQTVRYGNTFSYTIPNLTANRTYTVRLHFNEVYWGTQLAGNNGGVGSRVFNVAINGTQVLNNFDIYQTANGANKAVVEQFPATADSNGNITINFTTVTDNAMVSGIELYNGSLPTPTPTATPTPASSTLINTGGNAAENFAADTDFSGGTQYSTSASVDTSNVTSPAPQAVYQSVRYGNFTYNVPNLSPSTNYLVRLHFNELYHTSAGQRVFNVKINGSQVLSNFDIFQAAGGGNKAVVKDFIVPADSNGKLAIQFISVTDNAMVNGIEIIKPTIPQITYFTQNDGTNFSRATTPFTSGVATQTQNTDGSVSVNVNNVSSYADSGFVLYEGTLGNLPNFTTIGTGDQYGLNLWFDTNNDNEYFAWNNNILTGLNGDTYALSNSSQNGVENINGGTSFFLISDGQNHTLSDLKNGTVSGINANTKVAVWVGVNTSSGSTSSTIQSINGL